AAAWGSFVNTRLTPPTPPFKVPLRVSPPAARRAGSPHTISPLPPAPSVLPNTAAGGGGVIPHQALLASPPQCGFEVHERQAQHSFHPHPPGPTIWGFHGPCPRPPSLAPYRTPVGNRMPNHPPPPHPRPP